MAEHGAKILQFPRVGESSSRDVNEWVTQVTFEDNEVERLKKIYVQRDMAEDRNVGREMLLIRGTSIAFAEAVYNIVRNVAIVDYTKIAIIGNSSREKVTPGRHASESVPLIMGFTGSYGVDEVTAHGRRVLVDTDKILENLGLDFRLTQVGESSDKLSSQ